MHLNPYGEYAILLAASLANHWPRDREGIVARTRELGMTVAFPEQPRDHARVRGVIDEWLTVVDARDPHERARLLNAQMAAATAYPRLTDHDGEAGTCTTATTGPCRSPMSSRPSSAWAPPCTSPPAACIGSGAARRVRRPAIPARRW